MANQQWADVPFGSDDLFLDPPDTAASCAVDGDRMEVDQEEQEPPHQVWDLLSGLGGPTGVKQEDGSLAADAPDNYSDSATSSHEASELVFPSAILADDSATTTGAEGTVMPGIGVIGVGPMSSTSGTIRRPKTSLGTACD